MMTLILLSAVLTITITASETIRKGITAGRLQLDATKAFYAAETGAERILFDLRKDSLDLSAKGCNLNKMNLCFDGDPGSIKKCITSVDDCTNYSYIDYQGLGESYYTYKMKQELSGDSATTTILGSYNDIHRVVEVVY